MSRDWRSRLEVWADERSTALVDGRMERKTGFEPAAFSLARRCSTAELLPLVMHDYASCG